LSGIEDEFPAIVDAGVISNVREAG